jgi:uncharacterized protein
VSPSTYQARTVDGQLSDRMASIGAVLLEGPKACGKTATAARLAQSTFRLDVDPSARNAASVAPNLLLDSDKPVLLDEWQLEPGLWDHVRRAVDDQAPAKGLYLLTGSATPDDAAITHSGAGRIATISMRPMSLFESGHSTGAVSLRSLLAGETASALDPNLTVPDLIERICVGGWPTLLNATPAEALTWLTDYLDQIVLVDVPALGSRRNPEAIRRLLSALARNVGTDARISGLARDVGGAEGPIAHQTADAYLQALSRLRLTENSPAWAPHMRSATPLRSSATRYMVDPSLAVAALHQSPALLLRDLNATGFLFENLVVRDIRVYAQGLGGCIHHWRDANQHEVDIIVTLPDGTWGAFEVKMNPNDVDKAASSLTRFAGKIDHEKSGAPSALAVVTSTGLAHMRPDGVQVIPIGTLGP